MTIWAIEGVYHERHEAPITWPVAYRVSEEDARALVAILDRHLDVFRSTPPGGVILLDDDQLSTDRWIDTVMMDPMAAWVVRDAHAEPNGLSYRIRAFDETPEASYRAAVMEWCRSGSKMVASECLTCGAHANVPCRSIYDKHVIVMPHRDRGAEERSDPRHEVLAPNDIPLGVSHTFKLCHPGTSAPMLGATIDVESLDELVLNGRAVELDQQLPRAADAHREGWYGYIAMGTDIAIAVAYAGLPVRLRFRARANPENHFAGTDWITVSGRFLCGSGG